MTLLLLACLVLLLPVALFLTRCVRTSEDERLQAAADEAASRCEP